MGSGMSGNEYDFSCLQVDVIALCKSTSQNPALKPGIQTAQARRRSLSAQPASTKVRRRPRLQPVIVCLGFM